MQINFSPQTRPLTLTAFSKKTNFYFKIPISTIAKITTSRFWIPSFPWGCARILKEATCIKVFDSFCLLFHMSTLIFNSSVYSICSWSGPAGHQGHTHHSLPSGPLGSLCPLHSSHVGAYRKHWVASASHLRERKSTGLSLNFPKSATQPVLLYSMPLPCSVPWPQGQSWSCPLIS